MMSITKNDLQNMYIEHLEAEKRRLAKLFEEQRKSIIMSVLEENKMGKKVFTKKCYDHNEEYFQMLVSSLQELFVDSRVALSLVDDDSSKKCILLSIDWS
jgi:site-specific DNA-adenine methylase